MQRINRLIVMLVSSALIHCVHAEEVHVAVAANFTSAMKDIATQFEENSKHKITLSSGSSGKIFAQIQNGAPFQVFLSADQTKPEALERSGLSVPGSRFTYAVGALVLWSTKADLASDASHLKSGDFNKLALANPKLAPYGAAAEEVLASLQLTQATKSKWIMGENISQTYQFVSTGNADLGFVALSQVIQSNNSLPGSSWILPSELYRPIKQDAVLLKSAGNSAGAKALLEYLRSKEAQAIIRTYGYTTE